MPRSWLVFRRLPEDQDSGTCVTIVSIADALVEMTSNIYSRYRIYHVQRLHCQRVELWHFRSPPSIQKSNISCACEHACGLTLHSISVPDLQHKNHQPLLSCGRSKHGTVSTALCSSQNVCQLPLGSDHTNVAYIFRSEKFLKRTLLVSSAIRTCSNPTQSLHRFRPSLTISANRHWLTKTKLSLSR